MTNTLVWVDVPVRDLKRATEFYSRVLGAELQIFEENGFPLTALPHAGNGASGCLVESEHAGNDGLLVYFNVEGRLQAAASEAATGGEILEPPHPIGPYGFRAVIRDSEGNRIALHSSTG